MRLSRQARGRLLGLALTGLFLFLAVRRVDLVAFADALRHFNYGWIVPAAACTLLGYLVRTVRWQVILSGAARAPLRTLYPILMMGFATNNLLPGRLGEFWRAYLLGNKQKVRKTFALASVFVERVFDGLVLIGLLGVVSLAVPLPVWGREVELLAAALFLGASAVVALLVWRPALARRLVGVLLRPAPARARSWVDGAFGAFVDGLAVLRRPSVLASAAVLSVGVWLLEGSSYLVLSRGIDLGLPAGAELAAIGLTVVTINLGIMVPSAPGYVGAMEFFGTLALGVFGADPGAALAFVVVAHAVQYSLVTTIGLVCFAREHLSLGELRRPLRPPVPAEAEPSV
jgi:glycosyltransferase 2 family protein